MQMLQDTTQATATSEQREKWDQSAERGVELARERPRKEATLLCPLDSAGTAQSLPGFSIWGSRVLTALLKSPPRRGRAPRAPTHPRRRLPAPPAPAPPAPRLQGAASASPQPPPRAAPGLRPLSPQPRGGTQWVGRDGAGHGLRFQSSGPFLDLCPPAIPCLASRGGAGAGEEVARPAPRKVSNSACSERAQKGPASPPLTCPIS